MADTQWTRKDSADLRQAVVLLEQSGFLVTASHMLGSGIDSVMKKLPGQAEKLVELACEKALAAAARTAFHSLDGYGGLVSGDRLHMGLVAATGAAGGFFSWPGLVVELPVTTVLMLRSIADIAKAEGEDLSDPQTQVQCLSVLAMGADASRAGEEASYYSTRLGLAEASVGLSAYLSSKAGKANARTILEKIGPLMARLLGRYLPLVGEKALAQAAPVAGAIGGAIINPVFMRHFQNKGRGHFIVRRLERRFGEARVKSRYERCAAAMTRKPSGAYANRKAA